MLSLSLLLVISLNGCGPNHITQIRKEFGLGPQKISTDVHLKYSDFVSIDSIRLDSLNKKIGSQAFNEEMIFVGSRRSVAVSKGPIFHSTSYVTFWNEYMLYVARERAKLAGRGSLLYQQTEELIRLSETNFIFGFVFQSNTPIQLDQILIVASNPKGLSIKASKVDFSWILENRTFTSGAKIYRCDGRILIPKIDENQKSLVDPNVDWVKLTLLPGTTIQSFKFLIDPPDST